MAGKAMAYPFGHRATVGNEFSGTRGITGMIKTLWYPHPGHIKRRPARSARNSLIAAQSHPHARRYHSSSPRRGRSLPSEIENKTPF